MAGLIEFWFEFASSYSYPAATRVEAAAGASGIAVAWRPFLLGPIFRDQGWSDSPFNLYPAKGRYMWRDMERLCADLGLPFRRPAAFPRNGLLAARVACSHRDEPWIGDFVRAVYRANFAEDRDISTRETVSALLAGCVADPVAVLKRATDPASKRALARATDEARKLGIFGAPSFVAGGELFWGNDRLAAAIDWSRRAPADT
jgi:2-hydroxychromene-2-carboxylate isomerase